MKAEQVFEGWALHVPDQRRLLGADVHLEPRRKRPL